MKKLFSMIAIFGTIIFFGCNQAATKQKEMLDANAAVIKAIETGDKATLEKYISSDAVDHGGGPNGTDVKGAELINMLANMHTDIDNLKMEIVQQAANDDHVFSLVKMSGTTNKPMWGMPANFKIDGTSIDLLKIKDMKMVDHWSFMEPAEMMKMMPPPPPPGEQPMDGSMMPGDSTKN